MFYNLVIDLMSPLYVLLLYLYNCYIVNNMSQLQGNRHTLPDRENVNGVERRAKL